MVVPVLRLPLAHAAVTVSAEVKYDNGFPDLLFTAVDGTNIGVPDVTISVTPNGYASPVFTGNTNNTGVFTVKIAPPANYTWTASGPISQTGNKSVSSCVETEKPSLLDPCFEIDVTEDQALLIAALSAEFTPCTNGPSNSTFTPCNKGLALLNGLAELVDPSLVNALPPSTLTNSVTAVRYLQWLAELKNSLDNKKPSIPDEVWKTLNIEIAAGREALQDLGRIPQNPDPLSPIHAPSLPNATAIDTGDTVDYLVGMLESKNPKTAFRVGGVGYGLILVVYSFADLLIFNQDSGPLVLFPEGCSITDFSPGSNCVVKAEKALRLYSDLLTFAAGLEILVNVAGGFGGAAGAAATRILQAVAIIAIALQVLDLYNRYGDNPSKFLKDLTSFDPSLWLELGSIGSGLVSLAAGASFAIASGLLLGSTSLIYYLVGASDYLQAIADLRGQVSGQVTGLIQLRELLHGTNSTRLRIESSSLASFATIAGQVGLFANGTIRSDFLWMNYYFSRLSRAEFDLATKVDSARDSVDGLLKAYLYYQNTSSEECGVVRPAGIQVGSATEHCNVTANLVGYNVTKAEFPGGSQLPAFTFNAATYGRQSGGGVGFEKYEVPTDLSNKPPTTESSPANFTGWAGDPPAEHDEYSRCEHVGISDVECPPNDLLIASYQSNLGQRPSSTCGTVSHFCFLNGQDVFSPIRYNDVYTSNSRLVLDESNKPQTLILYKWYFSASNDCAPYVQHTPLGDVVVPCCSFSCTSRTAIKEWSDNINNLGPKVQNDLGGMKGVFHEYDLASHLKKPASFPFAYLTRWPMILNGQYGPSVLATDASGATNNPFDTLGQSGLPAIWYARCGGTTNECDLNRVDSINNQTENWTLGTAPQGTQPSGMAINPSNGDIFWTVNRTDGKQLWRKLGLSSLNSIPAILGIPISDLFTGVGLFTYWNVSLTTGAGRLALDSHGNPVFAEEKTTSIAKLDMTTNLIRTVNIGNTVKYLVSAPSNPDVLLFTEENANKIGSLDLSTCGTSTCDLIEWPIPTPDSKPSGITIDSNGNVWFVETAANRIAKLSLSLVQTGPEFHITEYPSGIVKSPRQVTIASPDQLFVTEASGAVDLISTAPVSDYIRRGNSSLVQPVSRKADVQTTSAATFTTPSLPTVYSTTPTTTTVNGSDPAGVDRFQTGGNPQGTSGGAGVGNMFYADPGNANIARFDGYVTTLPSIVQPSSTGPPVAVASNRIMEGNTNSGGTLTLDGSGSYAPNRSPLTFSWSGDCGTATGPTPVVFCPWHADNVANIEKLVVSNGTADSAPVFVKVLVVDTTPPTISAVREPASNIGDWTNQNVTVRFQCSDAVSGVSFVSEPVILPREGRNETANGYCGDRAGNIATNTVMDINIDKTPPNITGSASPRPNTKGWYNATVTVHFDCNDALSGVDSCTPDTVLTKEGRNQSVTGLARDLADNVASTSVTGINIDETPPVITSVQDGQAFILHQTVFPIAHCEDALSGTDACVLPNGPLDSNTVGVHTYTVTSTDKAGNLAVFSVHYSVHYAYASAFPKPPDTRFNLGRTIPVRFRLTDALGNFVSTARAQIWVDSLANPGKASGFNTSNYFRYDSTDNQYLFTLSTKSMAVGVHTIYITLDDGTVHTMTVTLAS